MDKTVAGLIGAVGALTATGPSQAQTGPSLASAMEARSYADLLKPIPDAAALLAEHARAARPGDEPARVQNAQYLVLPHHHHHRYYRPYYYQPYYYQPYGYRPPFPGPYYHHHHHHHHHHHDHY